MRRLSLLFVLCHWFFQIGTAQETPSIDSLDAHVQKIVKDFSLPAFSLAVVHKGEVIFSKGYGTANDKKNTDPNTLFGIASLSKAFTSASIAMLVEEGKLKWSDKVVDHLPWFQLSDPYVTANLTIEDLLCHRSGLKTFDGDLLWYGTNYDREEVIKRVKHRPLTYGFREEFGYQNIMFMTAGEVIEAVSGLTWDEFVKTRILKPVEMDRTTSSFRAFKSEANMAMPTLNGVVIPMLSYENSGATAALNSCADDMSAWARFWLNNGVVGDDTLLKVVSIKKLWSLHTPLNVSSFDEKNSVHFKGYGLGWFLQDFRGRKVVHHGGGLPGYITKLALVPEEDLGIVALCNDMSSVPSMMTYVVTDWLLGNDYKQWAPMYLDFKKRGEQREADKEAERLKEQEESPKTLSLKNYVGLYEDPMYGKAEISTDGGKLRITLLPAKDLFTGVMEPFSEHSFKFEFKDPFLPFGVVRFEVVDKRVNGFTIDLPNYDFHFDNLKFKPLAR